MQLLQITSLTKCGTRKFACEQELANKRLSNAKSGKYSEIEYNEKSYLQSLPDFFNATTLWLQQ